MRQAQPIKKFAVCARTRPSLFMVPWGNQRFETIEEARDHLVKVEQRASTALKKNYDLVVAEAVAGKWRAVDEVEEGLRGEDLAAIRREEERFAAGGGA